jgi:hypothetical protein
MEDHDFRVIEARAALSEACNRDPGEITRAELREEIARYQKYVRWLIDVADDAADTGYDEEVSQVTLCGGIYLSPADTLKLCGCCRKLIDVGWKSGYQQTSPSPPSASVSSAA